MIDIVHPVRQNDKALVYVLEESPYNPSGKGAGCFVGDLTIDSDPFSIRGPWIYAKHNYDEESDHEGFKIKDFRLWNYFISKEEIRQLIPQLDLGKLRVGKGMLQIDRELYVKIADIYAKKVEESKERAHRF